jgi:hypothetical protein
MTRETHDADLADGQLTKVQHSFSYSDGFEREIQKKIQAEPGPVPRRDADGRIMIGTNNQPLMTVKAITPRWVGSGWTLFNNKGKPVRQYEPFFTDTHRFECDICIGVSPVLFYDPLGRVVATLHPNHTWEKVVFDPWRQETWDVNDTVAKRGNDGTVLVADPKEDEQVGDFFRRLSEAEYLPTWYEQRLDGTLGTEERNAARKAAMHAETPTIACADALGRTFLTIAHNRFKFSNAPADEAPTEEHYRTRVIVDIEGNQREVIDAKGRIVMRYAYDILGNRIYQISMEAGERWMLNDATDKANRTWDSRRHAFNTEYDELRRPTHQYLRYHDGKRVLLSRIVYGEQHADSDERTGEHMLNLRGQIHLHFDQAGVVINERFDFKGNLLATTRRLARNYKPEKVESS